jgi:hypothetical protein
MKKYNEKDLIIVWLLTSIGYEQTKLKNGFVFANRLFSKINRLS